VQGITDMCAYSQVLPGYLARRPSRRTRETYLGKRTPKPLRPGQMNFPQNFPKWFTSLMKAWYGERRHEGQQLRLRLDCPNWDGAYDVLAIFDACSRAR
jgi:hypothetical protein